MNEGTPEHIEIAFEPRLAPYIRERSWHSSQHMTDRTDGGILLALDVANDWALRSWILSFGPLAKVLCPRRSRGKSATKSDARRRGTRSSRPRVRRVPARRGVPERPTHARDRRADDHLQAPPLGGHRHVARAAQQTVVVEAAFAAAVGHRQDVVGFPPRSAPRRRAPRRSRSAGGRTRLQARWACPMSVRQRRQMPASRFQTCSRTYAGLLRSRHSWTHASLQNVRRRGAAMTARHQRQIGCPSASRSGCPQRSGSTRLRRSVLTREIIGRSRRLHNSQFQLPMSNGLPTSSSQGAGTSGQRAVGCWKLSSWELSSESTRMFVHPSNAHG